MTPFRTLRWLMLLVLFLPFALYAATDPVPDEFERTWTSSNELPAVQHGIAQAIEVTVGGMAFYKRPFARTKLAQVAEPCERIRIYEDRGRLGIACDDDTPAVSVPDGRPVTFTNRHGQSFRLHQRVHGLRIEQVWEDEAGARRNTYTIGPDGSLRVRITIESDQLPAPVEYTYTFVAQG